MKTTRTKLSCFRMIEWNQLEWMEIGGRLTKKWRISSFLNPALVLLLVISERQLVIELLFFSVLVSIGLLIWEVIFFIRKRNASFSRYLSIILNLVSFIVVVVMCIFHLMIANFARWYMNHPSFADNSLHRKSTHQRIDLNNNKWKSKLYWYLKTMIVLRKK